MPLDPKRSIVACVLATMRLIASSQVASISCPSLRTKGVVNRCGLLFATHAFSPLGPSLPRFAMSSRQRERETHTDTHKQSSISISMFAVEHLPGSHVSLTSIRILCVMLSPAQIHTLTLQCFLTLDTPSDADYFPVLHANVEAAPVAAEHTRALYPSVRRVFNIVVAAHRPNTMEALTRTKRVCDRVSAAACHGLCVPVRNELTSVLLLVPALRLRALLSPQQQVDRQKGDSNTESCPLICVCSTRFWIQITVEASVRSRKGLH